MPIVLKASILGVFQNGIFFKLIIETGNFRKKPFCFD